MKIGSLEEYQQRVAYELAALLENLLKLKLFLFSEEASKIDKKQRAAMVKQSKIMQSYADVLATRLELFVSA